MAIVAIRKPASPVPSTKSIAGNQKAVDALPFDSGTWRVEGVPGLYLRSRARSKSFFIQRRIRGRLVKETLGQLSMKQARERAMSVWSSLKPKPAAGDVVTLEIAIERYLEEKTLAPKTVHNYRYNMKYLEGWKERALEAVGNDRAGFRYLHQQIRKQHGPAASNQVVRLVSAVYRWQRKIDTTLPEPPTTAVQVDAIPARNSAYSPEALKSWWHAQKKEKKSSKVLQQGVKTLKPLKRTWWLVALFTGARRGSVEALRWEDVDLENKSITFRVVKGNRPYVVPMSDVLAKLLTDYKRCAEVPPSEWLFPSPVIEGAHIVDVKNDREGVGPAHNLRHTFRTTLAQLGVAGDHARLLLGHSMSGDVSRGYVTASLVVESLRPITNAVAARYLEILGDDVQ